jgi:hypothetical protein
MATATSALLVAQTAGWSWLSCLTRFASLISTCVCAYECRAEDEYVEDVRIDDRVVSIPKM